jgi:hypothetical protein
VKCLTLSVAMVKKIKAMTTVGIATAYEYFKEQINCDNISLLWP